MIVIQLLLEFIVLGAGLSGSFFTLDTGLIIGVIAILTWFLLALVSAVSTLYFCYVFFRKKVVLDWLYLHGMLWMLVLTVLTVLLNVFVFNYESTRQSSASYFGLLAQMSTPLVFLNLLGWYAWVKKR